jgi:4-hydroxy-3-polyprenylbenzoate decarboxylase
MKPLPASSTKPYIVGITGASGAPYAWRLLEKMNQSGFEVYVVATKPGMEVFKHEMGFCLNEGLEKLKIGTFHLEDVDSFFSPVASGSRRFAGMIVCPCSMGTLGRISAGTSDNLLIRAADVCLKERFPLLLLTRETPLHAIHLDNMVRVTHASGVIMPISPSFYHHPTSIEDLIDQMMGRIYDHLNLAHDFHARWEEDHADSK